MEAGGLQRSEISFRRTGSSGLVWDDKFLGELAKIKPASSQDPDTASLTTLPRTRSDGGGAARQSGYKAVKVPSPSADPPSPKVSGCAGICGIFGKEEKQPRNKRAKRRV